MSEFVEEGKNGFKVSPGDVDGISKRLLWCSENHDELAKMSVACQPVITIEEQAEKAEAIYATLILRGALNNTLTTRSSIIDANASGDEM